MHPPPNGPASALVVKLHVCHHRRDMNPKQLTPSHFGLARRPPSLTLAATVLLLLCLLLLSSPLLRSQTAAERTVIQARIANSPTSEIVDAGPLPTSEPVELTLYLAPSGMQQTALQVLLADQINPSSPSYHHWLTPAQFGESFGATDDQLAALSAWINAQGLSVSSVAPAHNRVVVTGTAGQIETSFQVELHRFSSSAESYFANVSQPSLPSELAAFTSGVSGLDNLPAARPSTVASLTGRSLLSDPLSAIASLVDSNTSPAITVSTAACSIDLLPSEIALYRGLLRQANAQGITVLATSACGTRGSGSFPASLAEATSLTTSPSEATVVGIDPRPEWQGAPGLPADGMRQEPDLETSSAGDFAQAVSAILKKTGSRQGNINRNLYALAALPGLYTQPEAIPAGAWQPATGLGKIDLQALVKAYASGTSATTTSLVSSLYTATYGQAITLTSGVTATTSAAAPPSGTVTFTSTTQGTLGSAALSGGQAILATGALPVGTYTITANYSGDSNYAASSSTSSVVVTVSISNATVTATISPASGVPYGATATVTATVTLPNSTVAPAGSATAQIQGITGASYSNTLSPNMGSNTATTNIPVSVPPPAPTPYTISVTCTGNTNFQCQSPVNLLFTSVKGNSNVTLSVQPAAPQAGQPTSITATVVNAGNGTGTYTFSGSVSFFDNGKLLATAPVATNQATTVQTLSGNTTHSIVAIYTGDGNWNGSTSSAASVTPTILPSSLVLSSNAGNVASSLAGVNIVLTGTITTNVTNTAGPTGTVTFFDTFNGSVTQLGSPSVAVPNGPTAGIAQFATTGLLAGTHNIYAIYSGDNNFAPATSPVLQITIADYVLSMVPSTLTLTGGTSANVAIQMNLIGGFQGSVSFGCTPPAGSNATCSFSPASLSAGGVTTMTINTTAATTATSGTQSSRLHRGSGWGIGSGLSLASLLFLALPRRRHPAFKLLIVFGLSALLGLSGCGQGTTSTQATATTTTTAPANLGTPLGTTNFLITAAGTNGINTSRHTYQYQVTVE